ncbi:MAG: peptidylprolyl isomerase [Oscillospiraceae bacterium]|nr:peptidylprolyl isomerase [Oscillospiraceae bacterium]
MSASDKKKLRKEQVSATLTEKQRAQQKEEKKLKIYTIAFVAAMLALVAILVIALGVRGFKNAGIAEKSTIAAVVAGRELNTVEFNYYYNDAISEFYNEWYDESTGSADAYLQMLGLDTAKPLNEQVYNDETGETWADYFVEQALDKAKRDFALTDKAAADGFTLPEEDKTTVENVMNNLKTYATLYGFSNADQYLRNSYGYGSTAKSYREYYERTLLADAYYNNNEENISYEDSELRAYETEKFNNYSSFTYDSVYLSYTNFRTEGTEDEEGTVTYTEEQDNAARDAMKAAADLLATATNKEDLEAKLAEVKVAEGVSLKVTENKEVLYTQINGDLAEWLGAEGRVAGELGAIPSMSSDAEPKLNGYYIAIFGNRNDNTEPMGNVRHLLVSFEGGEEDEETGETVYTDEEKATAKAKAEELLKQWEEGEKTEESFIELLKEESDDTGVTENEGLYEDINPGSSYVENFLAWAIDPVRTEGDYGIVETEYGYHIMYYVGDSELSYRDSLITAEMRTAEQEAWYNSILDAVTAEKKDVSKLHLDLVLGG